MFDRDDFDPCDEEIELTEHSPRCGCPQCDPDFYFDRAEIHSEYFVEELPDTEILEDEHPEELPEAGDQRAA